MKILKRVLCVIATSLIVVVGGVQAEVISSASVMQAQAVQYNKQQLIALVSRTDVQSKLVSLGVDANDAFARIDAMTDDEIAQLNQHINDAPAGGIVGAVITVLAVIAILDLLGVTDVYPFIRPIT